MMSAGFCDDLYSTPVVVEIPPSGSAQAHPESGTYADILTQLLPRGTSFIGKLKSVRNDPATHHLLGTHVLTVWYDKDDKKWKVEWSRSISFDPVPHPEAERGRRVVTTIQKSWGIPSPDDFRRRLNVIVTMLVADSCKSLATHLTTDNWLVNPRQAVQILKDLYYLGRDPGDVDVSLQLPWAPSTQVHTYKAVVFRGGRALGYVGLQYRNGHWRYGVSVRPNAAFDGDLPGNPLERKHQAASSLKLEDLAQAQEAATKLYVMACHEWLYEASDQGFHF